jgi:Holliday junction resolvasome RuvABC endonuclease subunit
MILTIDPSSTATGYALADDAGNVIEAGVCRPDKALTPEVRAKQMAADLLTIIAEHYPATIVLEKPAKQAPAGRNHAGQATYGMAVGVILGVLWANGHTVTRVDAHVWKRGVPKARMIAWAKHRYPQYDAATDKGGDAADALGLLDWYLRERGAKPAGGDDD